jgi:hypothetical protein
MAKFYAVYVEGKEALVKTVYTDLASARMQAENIANQQPNLKVHILESVKILRVPTAPMQEQNP